MSVVLLAGYAHVRTLTPWKSHAAEILLQWLFPEDDVAAAVTRACGGRGGAGLDVADGHVHIVIAEDEARERLIIAHQQALRSMT